MVNFFWKWGIWLLAYPIIQVLSTLRHEGAHALAAHLEGAKITGFRIIPGSLDGRRQWGWCSWTSVRPMTEWAFLAPFIILPAIILFSLVLAEIVWRSANFSHHIWMTIMLFGVISPAVDTAAVYWRFKRDSGDLKDALRINPLARVRRLAALIFVLCTPGVFWFLAYLLSGLRS